MSLWPKSSIFSSSHKRMHAVSSIHNLSPACVYLASFFTVVNWTITLSFSVISLETSSQATSCFLLQKCWDSLFNTVKSWTYYVKHHVLALFIFLYSANMSWSFSLTELKTHSFCLDSDATTFMPYLKDNKPQFEYLLRQSVLFLKSHSKISV